jgi:hypothetical protein
MNSSLFTADRITHFKIVAVSLMAAIAVVAIGISARITESSFGTAQVQLDRVVVIAGKPTIYSVNDLVSMDPVKASHAIIK